MHIVASLVGLASSALASVETHLQSIGDKFRRLVSHPQAPAELRDVLPSIEATLTAHTQAIKALTEAVDQLHQAQQSAAPIVVPRAAPPVLSAAQVAAVDDTHAGAPSSTEPAAA